MDLFPQNSCISEFGDLGFGEMELNRLYWRCCSNNCVLSLFCLAVWLQLQFQ